MVELDGWKLIENEAPQNIILFRKLSCFYHSQIAILGAHSYPLLIQKIYTNETLLYPYNKLEMYKFYSTNNIFNNLKKIQILSNIQHITGLVFKGLAILFLAKNVTIKQTANWVKSL